MLRQSGWATSAAGVSRCIATYQRPPERSRISVPGRPCRLPPGCLCGLVVAQQKKRTQTLPTEDCPRTTWYGEFSLSIVEFRLTYCRVLHELPGLRIAPDGETLRDKRLKTIGKGHKNNIVIIDFLVNYDYIILFWE